jgi:hypothetical protein
LRVLDAEMRCTEPVENTFDELGLAFAHQPGVDVSAYTLSGPSALRRSI